MSLSIREPFPISNNFENNQESNVLKKAKMEDGQVRATQQGQKRAALSTITNNAMRIQPFRAAKQQAGFAGSKNDENAFSRLQQKTSVFAVPKSAQQSFSIHEDPEPVIASAQSRTHSMDSPMVIDSSDDEDFECTKETTPEIHDIDNGNDIFGVTEYASEIYQYLKKSELKNMPKPNYMKKQTDINHSMRSILVDWLVEVAEEYKLSLQTLYLTINYIDRFLSVMSVLRGKLQLVGTACMLIAAKFEEIYPPDISDFVYITDDTYNAKQVLKMESLILKTLGFEVCAPTILNFLERFLKAAECPEADKSKVESLAKYLCELSLLNGEPFLQYRPSTVAASAVVLSLHTIGLTSWNPTLAHYTGFQLLDLQACVHDLHRAFSHAPKQQQQSIREKYKSSSCHGVANLPAPEMLPLA
ncbi:hypothetical protein pdam_00012863 [Pocillopora damicornis]|uniref:Cyclin-A2 n=1 Tax=Pocillopora damicornis TaxID=46731 RepID=A0A3M6UUE1_POCDA|nr:hypothetical protein pdam_00012863 [Pocillopora damicornis]